MHSTASATGGAVAELEAIITDAAAAGASELVFDTDAPIDPDRARTS